LQIAVIAAASLFFQTFAGTWTCTSEVPASKDAPAHSVSTKWVVSVEPGVENWTVVRWGGPGAAGGTAYVGYVPSLKQWIYDDYHGDGTYARSTAAAPKDNAWDWFGTYYGPDGQTNYGPITWKLSALNRIDRTFSRTGDDGKPVVLGRDFCTKG
jgi:hypothetical protein